MIDLLQFALVLSMVIILAIPMGRYLALAFSLEKTGLDRLFGWAIKSFFML